MNLRAPVAFIIFNRPETTKKVFEAIRKAQPSILYVIADGPRENKDGEIEKFNETRKIIDCVDWTCKIIKNFSEVNLGCKNRLSSGINWVFEQTDEAIFLEDDCLPSQAFFSFCDELLERYRNDNRIMNISGINLQLGKNTTEFDYYFSRYVHVWGWASWKRAWKYYDLNMSQWNMAKRKNLLEDYFDNNRAKRHWYKEFQKTYAGEIDTWDYQWVFACWIEKGLSIIPSKNLVSNIGFSEEAVHTKDFLSEWANIPAEEILFPLNHPIEILRNKEADLNTQNTHYSPGIFYRAKRKFGKIILGRAK
jgi:hypothetical protein